MKLRSLLLGLAVLLSPGWGSAAEYASELRFVRDGQTQRVLSLDSLRRECGGVRVEVDDPYYLRSKRFYACPLRNLLLRAFDMSESELREATFFLRARDGYTRTESGARLLESGAHLALADVDLSAGDPFASAEAGEVFTPKWEPIDRRQVDPGPFYLVWTGSDQNDPHRYPWPYQLATLEIGSFAQAFPHLVPSGAPKGSPPEAGFTIFQRECMACHAINGEGGTVGPDLNIPLSIVEYRPVEQIKRFIRNPANFRYTSMPSHLHLETPELDALIAYFTWMKDRKFDAKAASSD